MASTAAALSITAAAAAATASASAAVKKPTAAKVNVLELVTHLDYALMAVVGLFVLAAVPRLVYRFSRIAEWRGPHILRRGEPAFEHANYGGGAKVYMEDDGASVFSAREFAAGATTEDHHYIPTRAAPIPRTEPAPLRARSYASHFPRIAAVFRAPIYAGGMPISHFLILLIYFVFVTYATLYKSSPFSDGRRTGFVSVSQLPILIALAMKNNPAGMIVGLSYEKVRELTPCLWRAFSRLSRSITFTASLVDLLSCVGIYMLSITVSYHRCY
jgi:ferric-chelate reductase